MHCNKTLCSIKFLIKMLSSFFCKTLFEVKIINQSRDNSLLISWSRIKPFSFSYSNMMERRLELLGSDSRSFASSTIVESQITCIFSIMYALAIKSFANITSCSLPVNPFNVTDFNFSKNSKQYISRVSQNIDLTYGRAQSSSSVVILEVEALFALFACKTQLHLKHHSIMKIQSFLKLLQTYRYSDFQSIEKAARHQHVRKRQNFSYVVQIQIDRQGQKLSKNVYWLRFLH